MSGPFYRVRQFWKALTAVPDPDDLARAKQVLSPPLFELFSRLQANEQAHSLWIYRRLCEQNEQNHDLMVAALLHDVGKSCHPLHLWERVFIVVGKRLFPERVKTWGQAPPRGWKRPFVVAEKHARWGAELAERAGASPLAVALIRRHQERVEPAFTKGETAQPTYEENLLLFQLQMMDEES